MAGYHEEADVFAGRANRVGDRCPFERAPGSERGDIDNGDGSAPVPMRHFDHSMHP